MLSIGVGLIIVSAVYSSSFLAFLGTVIVFWAVILRYITPVRHVPLALLNASVNSSASNIERVLVEFGLWEKGIYLPPKNLENNTSSLVFIPKVAETALPTSEESTPKLYSKQKKGVFLTPPGLDLSLLFEHEINDLFIKIDIVKLQKILPKLLVKDLEIAEKIDLEVKENIVIITIKSSLFDSVCCETDRAPRTHGQVGCLLSSALACVLAKATGKPIIIQKETRTSQSKTTTIEYRIEDEQNAAPTPNLY